MNVTKTGPLHRFAALLMLAGCSAVAGAAETGTPQAEPDPTQPTAAEVAIGNAKQDEACATGACAQADVGKQKVDVVIGAALLPKLDLPALLGTEDVAEGC